MASGRCVALVGFALLQCWGVRSAAAAEAPARVSVLTMGPGAHPFTRFGHDALLLEWQGAGGQRDLVYNFGTFAFRGVQGVSDFMTGRFRYWLSVSTLERTRETYGEAGRSLVAQELELDADQRAQLAEALALNALPARRYYDYDYYRDNCATRLRDVLDQTLGGQLQRGVSGAGRLTFRQHTLRLVGSSPSLYFGLDLALGSTTDRPISRYEELFLPGELHDELARATIERAGQRLPLVRGERRLLESAQPALPADPPDTRASFAGAGLLLGALGAVLGRGAARARALRVAFGSWSAVLGLSAGLVGCVLAGFWALSKHWAAYRNYSLLLCPPWALWLGVCGVALALGRPRARARLEVAAAVLAGSSALALLLSSFPGAGPAGQELPLAFLPLWLGMLLGAKLSALSGSKAKLVVAPPSSDPAET
ncbi:MAG TPA: DUF4105 domain-containing protein [Polyangiaceae bacterium]